MVTGGGDRQGTIVGVGLLSWYQVAVFVKALACE